MATKALNLTQYLRRYPKLLVENCVQLDLEQAMKMMTKVKRANPMNSPFLPYDADVLAALKLIKYGPKAAKFSPSQRRIAASIQRRWSKRIAA